jgi:hypothetical protein
MRSSPTCQAKSDFNVSGGCGSRRCYLNGEHPLGAEAQKLFCAQQSGVVHSSYDRRGAWRRPENSKLRQRAAA